MISRHGAFTSYQANVDAPGQNIAGDAANEALDRGGPHRPQQDGHWLEAIQQRGLQTSGRPAGDTPATAARRGRPRAFSRE